MGSERSQEGEFPEDVTRARRDVSVGHKPVALALLTLLAIVSLAAVSGLSRVYHRQQAALGNRWFTRGVADLRVGHFESAVGEFRTALLYSRDDYSYQLNLAQALAGLKRIHEANAYLVNLWERQPDNGQVNLELARIGAREGDNEAALRYYHNAIYTVWPGDQQTQQREVRLELIEYLLNINAKAQAQSELIALAANLDGDPSQHERAGALFLRAGDYEHALAEFRLALKLDHRNAGALAGAGWAAFELAQYPVAARYLQSAVTADPHDDRSSARLKIARLVLEMDPFQRQLPAAQRDQIVMRAFAAAGERLNNCAGTNGPGALHEDLSDSWNKMKPRITEKGFGHDPDLVEKAMQLTFDIERQTSTCGALAETDSALLLIAKLHDGY